MTLSVVPPKNAPGVFSAVPPAASGQRRSAGRPSSRAGELAEELVIAAFVVVVACILLAAGVALAYCSAKSAACRDLLPGVWLALR